MSQTAIVINGDSGRADVGISPDANTNLVTRLSELISSGKQMETVNSMDTKQSILTFPCDFDHMYASMKDGLTLPNENSECKQCKHLKEFCLLHLDLIQQQSETVAKQEKQLQSLRQENETLKMRLQRMDRRVGLNKTKDGEVSSPSMINCSVPVISLSEAVLSTVSGSESARRSCEAEHGDMVVVGPSSPRSPTLSAGDRTKKVVRHSQSRWDLQHHLPREDCAASISSAGELRDDASSTTASQQSFVAQTNTHQVDNRASIPQKSRGKQNLSLSRKESPLEDSVSQSTASVIERLSKKVKSKPTVPVLTTDKPYYTPLGDTEVIWEAEEPESEHEVNGDLLEIPKWRLKTYTSVYSMEGTENLDDEIFLKRHQKLEFDERRRKRWDVQRIREQRHIEKLRQREASAGGSGGGGSGDGTVTSLWPALDDAWYLEVSDELPVSAFGHPVAKFEPSAFSLPWLQGASSRKAAPSASSNARNRRRTTSDIRRKRISRSSSRQSFGTRTSLQRGSSTRSFPLRRRSETSEKK